MTKTTEKRKDATVLCYGGGRQTIAMALMVVKGVLPRPDMIVMADTSRENPQTWEYLEKYVQPELRAHGLEVEIAPHELSKCDMYSYKGNLLIPAWTTTGKMSTYCSSEWKTRVCDRYQRSKGIYGGTKWLGLAYEEKRRWKDKHNRQDGPWLTKCPMAEHLITTDMALAIIKAHGWPEPQISSCFMCPHKRDPEWLDLKTNYPEQWTEAVRIDESIRNELEGRQVYLHHSRVPLAEADLTKPAPKGSQHVCNKSHCFT